MAVGEGAELADLRCVRRGWIAQMGRVGVAAERTGRGEFGALAADGDTGDEVCHGHFDVELDDVGDGVELDIARKGGASARE